MSDVIDQSDTTPPNENPFGFLLRFADFGGPDIPTHVSNVIRNLLIALELHCSNKYSDSIDRLEIIVEVDGKIAQWGLDGFRRVKLYKSKRFISGTVNISAKAWSDLSQMELAMRLINTTSDLAIAFIERLASRNIEIRGDELMNDISGARGTFFNLMDQGV